ncbi:MAG: DUF6089 family protein [Bacteroidales bacterium]|nr:DUF6089 family protein [Bacteroidales bacterium]
MTARRLHILLTAVLLSISAKAQVGDLLDYQQEIGGGLGISSYIGDAGGGLTKNPGFMGTLIWRRNYNPRMSVKTNLAFGHISGDSKGIFIPENPLSQTPEGGTRAHTIRFSRQLLDLGAQFEFNFLGYGIGAAYKGVKRWTPYLLGGAEITLAMGGGAPTAGAFTIPLGAGFRYKIKPRLNIGLEWSINFTTTDRLDDANDPTHLRDPYGVESGTFKNKDCYMKTFIFLTYDIAPKYRKCNN